MPEEMRKYYTVSTFSGIPDRQSLWLVTKTKIKMRTRMLPVLRIWTGCRHCVLWLQKGHQKAIIVYQDMLQTGKYDSALKSTVWSDYKNDKLTDAISCATWYVSRWWMWQQVSGLPGRRWIMNIKCFHHCPTRMKPVRLIWQSSKSCNLSKRPIKRW